MKRPGSGCTLALLLLSIAILSNGCGPRSHSAGTIRVITVEGGQKLFVDGRLRAYADTSTWESRLKYAAVMNLPMRFFKAPGRALIIGSGAGSLVRNYSKKNWKVDSVEPDSTLTALAGHSFGLRADEGRTFHQSGRAFLETSTERYEVILQDLVGAEAPDPRLVTSEFCGMVKAHLDPGGIFALSFECAGWQAEIVRSIAATLGHELQKVIVLPIAEPPNRFCSIVLVGTAGEFPGLAQELDRNAELDPEWRFGPAYQETHAWDNRFELSAGEGAIQSDAHNTLGRLFKAVDDSARAQGEGYLP